MKTALLFAVVIVTPSSLPLLSHQTDAVAKGNGSTGAQEPARAETLHAIHAEVIRGLDTSSADAAAAIVIATHEPFESTDGIEIPAGSRLIGHLTQGRRVGAEPAEANLLLVLDSAELVGGQTLPLHSSLAAVALSVSADAASASGSGTPAFPHNFHLDPGTQVVLGISPNRSAD